MKEHDRRGVLLQRLLYDNSGVHGRPVDGAAEKLLDFDEARSCVEVDDAEDLVAAPGELEP